MVEDANLGGDCNHYQQYHIYNVLVEMQGWHNILSVVWFSHNIVHGTISQGVRAVSEAGGTNN